MRLSWLFLALVTTFVGATTASTFQPQAVKAPKLHKRNDLGFQGLSTLLANKSATAKVATSLLLLNGSLFRFADDFALKEILEVEEPTNKDRVLLRRIGRRFLALGVGAFNLFCRGCSPMSAVGTSAAVLLLDRANRDHDGAVSSFASSETIQWERFLGVTRLHLYSVLTWIGVLHPVLPCAERVTQVLGGIMGVLAARDVLFPDTFEDEDTHETITLRQASGYAMAGLALFSEFWDPRQSS